MREPWRLLFDLYGHYSLTLALRFKLVEYIVDAQEDGSLPILEQIVKWCLCLIGDWRGGSAMEDLNLGDVGVFV